MDKSARKSRRETAWHSRLPLCPPVVELAISLPSALHPGSDGTLWEDIREILLDPAPDPAAAETVHRWLRDQLQTELESKIARCPPRSIILWAARTAPRMLWILPCSISPPSPRDIRRIAAILLPGKLRAAKEELTRFAFFWGLSSK
jgi:hypothetical protein